MKRIRKRKSKHVEPLEVVVGLYRGLEAVIAELRGARRIGDGLRALETEQPEKYGSLIADLKAWLQRDAAV